MLKTSEVIAAPDDPGGWSRRVAEMFTRISGSLPRGRALPSVVWKRRHRGICILVWLHVPPLVLYAMSTGMSLGHGLIDVAPIALCGLCALGPWSRAVQSTIATIGLVTCSAVLVHLSHGTIEMHFHYFVVIGVITLYQQWAPFITAIVFVGLQHGVIGVLDPVAVYDHDSAQQRPWVWAGVHAGFVVAASVAHVLAWRLNEEQASVDSLTKLANRAVFTERVDQALAARSRTGRPFAVLFVDLDRFKEINDTLGHPTGDRVLVAAAQRLRSVVRPADLVARLGGDEFAIFIDDRTADAAAEVAGQIVHRLGTAFRVDGRELSIGASVGILVVTDEQSVLQVLRNADLAMYMAKSAGRGRYEFYNDDLRLDAVQRAELEADLREAIAAGDIEVFFQPTFRLGDGTTSGVEALARWNHPTRGPVPPLEFIAVAERCGLIHELGRHLLRTACAQGAELRRMAPDLEVAVNVSAAQLADPDFVQQVIDALHDTALEPRALVLELTESVLMYDTDTTVDRLNRLRTLGIRIAIDDFGTGYSSLSYLRHLPLDILKIDRSFVDNLDSSNTEFVSTILRLSRSLGLSVVAEGIETTAELEILTKLGCDLGQGFLYAQPMSQADLKRHLAAGAASPANEPSSRPPG